MKKTTDLAGKTVVMKSLKKLKKLKNRSHQVRMNSSGKMDYLAGTTVVIGNKIGKNAYVLATGDSWVISPWMVQEIVSDISTKDWRNAFTETQPHIKKVTHASADALLITRSSDCRTYRILMAYVLQFPTGGFWLSDGNLFFVTKGVGSDHNSSYEDAETFIKNYTGGDN